MSQAPAHSQADEHHDEHGYDHPWFLGHHWESPNQQFEAGKLGMWLFLATEVLLFGGLFCGYAVWRGNHPELFKFGSEFLDTALGATNTAVLILSSLTMAWAVTAAQQNKQTLLKIMLTLTLAGAATFLVIKYFEYTHKFHEGIYPGISYYELPGEMSHWYDKGEGVYTKPELTIPPAEPAPPPEDMPMAEPSVVPEAASGPGGLDVDALSTLETTEHEPHGDDHLAKDVHPADEGQATADTDHGETGAHPTHHLQNPLRPRDAHMFFNIYYMMTGLHGIHVLVGMIVISWLLVKAFKGQFGSDYFTPVDLGGLYWHVVDLIWIFLFPLFYLI